MKPLEEMTLGSLFDGSGGFPLAGLLSGIKPVWASEIEPFPIGVTTKRLPFMKHYGDISAMNGAEVEPVDIITFGSPCQDMSVAGKRAGLDGSRSNLFYEAVRIIKEMRCATNGKYPRSIVWENVPGAFSSNKGDDFRCVLESVCQIKDETAVIPQPDRWQPAGEIVGDDYSVAWRVLDAQYWGVPQRRKRIFLVADFAGRRAGKILFESEGLSGYSAQSLRTWQETACRSGESPDSPSLCLNDQGGSRLDVTEEVTNTLRAEAHHPPCVMDNKETTGALRTETYSAGQPIYHSSKNSFQTNFTSDEATDTLVATDYKDPPVVGTEYIVRRLTPTECARLQGFPNWWCADLGTENPTEEDIAFWRGVFETHRKIMGTSTKPKTDNQLIKWIKNPHSDSAEYKMWGNGIALPCAVFVLEGIKYFDKKGDPAFLAREEAEQVLKEREENG